MTEKAERIPMLHRENRLRLSTILARPSSTMSRSNIAIWLLISLRSEEGVLDDPGQYLRAREGECELGTLAIGKRSMCACPRTAALDSNRTIGELLFDHRVCAGEQHRRDFQAERLGGL
jgi:hypothetical protein